MLMLGLSASLSDAQTPVALTLADCRKVFPGARSSAVVRTLDSNVQCTEVWEGSTWGPAEGFLGYIFQKSQAYEGKTLEILVGIKSTGVITSVGVTGFARVPEEFLLQYRGKTVQGSFELARTTEDLLFVPAKIKALQGNLALSESIAQGVKDIARSARQVLE